MSDCSTHSFEYPGMSRLIIRWTDPNERVHNWPFVSNGREVASVEVDGIEYVNAEKLKATNGELCAEVNEKDKLIANRDESIHNLMALLDKRQERIAELEKLVRDVRFCSNVPKCSCCPCLWDGGCSMEFDKRFKALGIEVDE